MPEPEFEAILAQRPREVQNCGAGVGLDNDKAALDAITILASGAGAVGMCLGRSAATGRRRRS